MRISHRFTNWLETHWVTPAYSGWLLINLSIFFFIAGTNTLSGWLYVMSGIGLALLAIAALLPRRTLHQLAIRRVPIHPVSAGDLFTSEVVVENRSPQPKSLLQVQDYLPASLGKPIAQSIDTIAPHSAFHWVYSQPTARRGIYRWQTLHLRTGAPLGLFWGRQMQSVPTSVVVYPTVLSLTQCPLIDEIGQDEKRLFTRDRRAQSATEGLTRSLRPYRWGDPIRLVHWRTSARYGELRVRELERWTGGQDLVICLDSASSWQMDNSGEIEPRSPTKSAPSSFSPPQSEAFEQAVIAAASLYFYGYKRQINVKLWTAGSGLIQGNLPVLETLAGIQPGEPAQTDRHPATSIIWLTSNRSSLQALPNGSRWLLWERNPEPPMGDSPALFSDRHPGLIIDPAESLTLQLQATLISTVE